MSTETFYQLAFNELYSVNTLINMVKSSCEEKEFNAQYYGIAPECIKLLSAERNDYINMFEIISDKISNILELNLSYEAELTLENNANNCSREIAAKSTTNKCP